MTAGVLFDSDVVIELLRERQPVLDQAVALRRSGVRSYCCAVAYAEIFRGVRAGEETLAAEFFEARGEVILDGRVGRRAGGYLARYAKSHGLEIADALTAAAASESGLWLWTRNRRHYPMSDVRFYEPPSGGR